MLIGVPKEIKNHEYRVGLTPAGTRELVTHGHEVMVQNRRRRRHRPDGRHVPQRRSQHRRQCRGHLCPRGHDHQGQGTTAERMQNAALEGQIAVHLPASRARSRADPPAGGKSGATCIAYETVTDDHGGLPLLAPDERSGRTYGRAGRRPCPAESPGRRRRSARWRAGGGSRRTSWSSAVAWSALNAARMAMGMGANVTIIDRSLPRLQQIDDLYGERLSTLYSNARQHRGTAERGRPGDRRRADSGRRGAQAGHPRHAEADETGFGAGGCRHRPGRLFRNQPRHDPRGADLYRGRHHPLLRRQYARRCRQHRRPLP